MAEPYLLHQHCLQERYKLSITFCPLESDLILILSQKTVFFVSWCLLSRIKELQLCDLKCRKISKSGLLLNFPQSIAINCTESENQSIYCKCTFCTSFLFQRAKIHHDLKQKKFPPCNQCPCNYFTISKPYHLHRLCLQQQQR